MRRDNQQTLGEAIREFLKRNSLDEKLYETEIFGRWEELVGREVNLRTRKVVLKEGVLIVYLNSSVLRNELSMRKTELLEHINMRLRNNPIRGLEFR